MVLLNSLFYYFSQVQKFWSDVEAAAFNIGFIDLQFQVIINQHKIDTRAFTGKPFRLGNKQCRRIGRTGGNSFNAAAYLIGNKKYMTIIGRSMCREFFNDDGLSGSRSFRSV